MDQVTRDAAVRLIDGLLDGDATSVSSAAAELGGISAVRVSTATFVCALDRQFPDEVSADEISRHVDHVETRLPDGDRLEGLQAEAVIRGSLGDFDMLEGVPTQQILDTHVAVLRVASDELKLSGEGRARFVANVLDVLS